MALRINTNVEAVAAHRHVRVASDRLAVAMQRLSSGLRINTAADDAAGLGISERLRGQIRGLEQANRNIQDGISMLQTAEAALETVHQILHRARELAVQYNNGVYSTAQKQAISRELIQLSNEVARIEGQTQFNGIPLLQNAMATITLQVGANAGVTDTISVSMADLFGAGLSLVRPVTFFTLPWLQADISGFDLHIQDVATARGRMGAMVNRLEHSLSANQTQIESYMAAESRIRDADMAREMTTLVRQKVLQQSSMAMLAHAQGPSGRGRINELLK
jgi:flagellin